MKRTLPWSDKEEDDDSSSDESSSSSYSDSENENGTGKGNLAKKSSKAKSVKRKSSAIDFDALRRHGYKGGLSVLKVPPPKEPEQRDWSWSSGKESKSTDNKEETEESYRERQKTRDAIANAEELATVITRKDREKMSIAQKEKRKRDLGQTSRGKSYVEEEKRLLRDNGVYSGFD